MLARKFGVINIMMLFAITALFGAIARADIQQPTTDWQAEWIGPAELGDDPAPVNTWVEFSKTFTLDKKPEKATLRIACDSKYYLFVNFEADVLNGQLKRGPKPDATYFDVVDITDSIQQGKNRVRVLIWHFGKDGFSHVSSGKAGLLFELDLGEGEKIVSDSSWKTKINSAVTTAPEPLPNYRLPESSFRLETQSMEDLLKEPWFDAKSFGKPPVQPFGEMYERPTPMWKDYGLKDYVNNEDLNLPFKSDGKPIVCKLPYNGHFSPEMEIFSPEAGKLIDIRTDNYQGGGEYNMRYEYLTCKGWQKIELFGWINGHEMIYTIPEGIEVKELKYRETGFGCEFTGAFHCEDEFYNKLWEKSRRTLYITMRDTYMDCPDRERAQWWGDAVNEIGEAFYALSPESHTLAHKGIHELMNWQSEDGSIHSPVPGNFDKELPMQMLNSVGWYGFRLYHLYTGDTDTIVDVYPRVSKYMDLWKIGDDGLVVQRPGGWTWGDWGPNKDMPILYNGWYYLALRGQLDMAKTAGHEDEIPAIEKKMAAIRANFNKAFWTGTEYRSKNYKDDTDDRANALAVVAGLATPEQYPVIRKVLLEHENASPYMEKYVLEALCMMGYEDDALARMKRRFQVQVDSPLTTLWEGWGIGSEGYGGGTYNHAWSGGGLTILSQYITGIHPTSPGFETFEVRPQLGSLKHVKASVDSVKGMIHVEIDRADDDSSITMQVEVPEDTEATVCVPTRQLGGLPSKINENGPADAERLSDEGGYLRFKVKPGKWEFTVEK